MSFFPSGLEVGQTFTFDTFDDLERPVAHRRPLATSVVGKTASQQEARLAIHQDHGWTNGACGTGPCQMDMDSTVRGSAPFHWMENSQSVWSAGSAYMHPKALNGPNKGAHTSHTVNRVGATSLRAERTRGRPAAARPTCPSLSSPPHAADAVGRGAAAGQRRAERKTRGGRWSGAPQWGGGGGHA